MPSLQIRELPDDLYEALALRARLEKRSLAQQAVAELQRTLPGSSPRLLVLADVRKQLTRSGPRRAGRNLEKLIREDRER